MLTHINVTISTKRSINYITLFIDIGMTYFLNGGVQL